MCHLADFRGGGRINDGGPARQRRPRNTGRGNTGRGNVGAGIPVAEYRQGNTGRGTPAPEHRCRNTGSGTPAPEGPAI